MNGLLKAIGVILPFAVFLFLLFFLGRKQIRAIAGFVGKSSTQGEQMPSGVSVRSRPLLTEAEAVFYEALKTAVGSRYLVFAQVPLCVVVDVYSKNPRDQRSFYNRIDRRRVDFVLVDPERLMAKSVIELDHRYRMLDHMIARDQLVEAVLTQAGIKLFRLKAQAAHDPASLRRVLGLSQSDEKARC